MFNMRKSDGDLMAYLEQNNVPGKLDTFLFKGIPVVFLRAQQNETKKKEAMIFVHGSPGSMDAHLEYMVDSTLLRHVDLITYDRPGFGHSDFGHAMPSLTMQTQTLTALMDTLGYERYWLAGHSYGGPIIVQAAMQRPKTIAGICIVAGSVSPELEPKAQWRKWIDIPFLRQLLPTTMRVSNEELMPLRQDLMMIEDDWDKIKARVSICHGTKDVLVPFANLAYAQEKLVNAEKVFVKIFEGKNHFILWTDKPAVVEEMLKLLGVQNGERVTTAR
jgi:pimeloyl-ACP methyl ester carboxylesterase